MATEPMTPQQQKEHDEKTRLERERREREQSDRQGQNPGSKRDDDNRKSP